MGILSCKQYHIAKHMLFTGSLSRCLGEELSRKAAESLYKFSSFGCSSPGMSLGQREEKDEGKNQGGE